MNKVDIVQKAVLSVDKKYLKERYSGEIHIPYGLVYGEGLTDRCKKRVRRVCGKGYPGGEIAVVIDHSLFHNFGDGYLFTDKGFYATKGNLTAAGSFKKQGIPPLAYEDIVSVEVVKIYSKNDYICIRTSDSEYTGFASIYAPYFCEAIKKILHDLHDKPVCSTQYQIKKQERAAKKAKAAEEKKMKESEPAKEVIDMLWEEAMAMPEKQHEPQSPSVAQTPKAVSSAGERPEEQTAAPKKAPLPMCAPYIAVVGKGKENLLTAEEYGVKMHPFRMADFSCHGFIQALCESKRQFDGVVYFTTFEEFAAEDGAYVKKMIALGIRRMIIVCDNFADPMDEVTFIDIMSEIGSFLQEIGIPPDQFSYVICEVKEHRVKEEDLDGMRELYQQINDKIILPASGSKPFLMPIDEVFSLKEPVSVIATGNVMQGSLKKGDAVEIVGFEKRISSQVSMLEMFRKSIEYVEEGDAPGIALKDVSAKEIERGMLIAAPGSAKMAGEINAVIYALTKNEDGRSVAPIPKISRPQFCIDGVKITCLVQLPDNTEFLFPGDCCSAKISLILDIPYVSGMRFTLCGPNYIAEGSIL